MFGHVQEVVEIRAPARAGDKLMPVVLSLSRLLDYQEDDTQESSFEVSVFAEMFRLMLDVRFGCGICRVLAQLQACPP